MLRTGPGVNAWRPGDEVVAHCLSVELESSDGHNDTMLDPEQRIWGFETNFGGLAELALVKSNQLMPKPQHLSWEEAAAPGLVNSTAYRQLVSRNGAGMKQGDNVLIWGASGGLGSYATQFALAGGANPVCVVSSDRKAEICRRMGAEAIIDRTAEGYAFWKDEHHQDPREWKRFGKRIRELTGGEDVDIVFEHPGRETFGASVYVTRKGGTIVTCASTSGYTHEYDNRYLWMSLKRIVGSHFANYREAWEANRLVAKGKIHPTLSRVYALEDTGQAAYDVHRNLHQGKVGVLALAPREGLGVRDEEKRAKHIDAINLFRDAPAERTDKHRRDERGADRQTRRDEPAERTDAPAPPAGLSGDGPSEGPALADADLRGPLHRRGVQRALPGGISPRARPACPSPSTCRPRRGTTPTTSWPVARSAGSAYRSPISATCDGCSRASRWSGRTPR